MKLVASEEGRSLQLISMDEIRPLRGGPFPPAVLSTIVGRYSFTSYPTTYEPNTTIKFKNGITQAGDLHIPIIGLDIYGDGVLVSARNTDDSDLALDQFVSWAVQEFRLREPTTIVPRKYVSRLVVDIEGGFDHLAASLRVFSSIVSKALDSPSENLSIVDLRVGPFPPTQYPYQSTWQLETRILEPHVPGRYLSTAPLSTTAHYKLLEQIEAALRRN